jgi:hypothetical protein
VSRVVREKNRGKEAPNRYAKEEAVIERAREDLPDMPMKSEEGSTRETDHKRRIECVVAAERVRPVHYPGRRRVGHVKHRFGIRESQKQEI